MNTLEIHKKWNLKLHLVQKHLNPFDNNIILIFHELLPEPWYCTQIHVFELHVQAPHLFNGLSLNAAFGGRNGTG